jgi:hypothetical protein
MPAPYDRYHYRHCRWMHRAATLHPPSLPVFFGCSWLADSKADVDKQELLPWKAVLVVPNRLADFLQGDMWGVGLVLAQLLARPAAPPILGGASRAALLLSVVAIRELR